MLFSTVAVSVHVATGSAGGLPSLHPSPACTVCRFVLMMTVLTGVR